MASADNKKKTPRALFLLVFAAIVIAMFIINYRSTLVQELPGPKSGVEQLSTCVDKLVAVSRSNDIYAWNWNDLSGWPQVGYIKAQKMVAMNSDRIVWVPSATNKVLVVSDLKGDRELNRLSLRAGKRCKWLEVSPNGKYAVTGLVVDGTSDRHIQLAITDSDLTSISQVVTKTVGDKFKLKNIGISNDGVLISAVGGKDAGWILVANAQSKQIIWEQITPDSRELNNVIFSPDGKMAYASEPGRYVYVFESDTGKLVKQLTIDKYKTPPNNPQTIACIAASPDGRLLAAVTAPASQIWIWDAKSGAKLTVINTGQFATSGISFSPDSSLLATADLTTSSIKIWRISERTN